MSKNKNAQKIKKIKTMTEKRVILELSQTNKLKVITIFTLGYKGKLWILKETVTITEQL